MCGRFVSVSPPDEIARYFDAAAPEAVLEPSYNVAPTEDAYVVLSDGAGRRVEALHWGLVPSWARDPRIGSRMINARAEALASSNAFKAALRRRRCLVPADGFYEWRPVAGTRRKQPCFVHHPGGEPLALAGLWEEWRRPGGPGNDRLRSFTIVTTPPNDVLAPIHDRMPAILPPEVWGAWLDPGRADPEVLSRLLVPAPASLTVAHPVSTEVNDARHQGRHLVEEVPAEEVAGAG
ncbi:MAG TPA: SOS response-associated peptidase [Acidimicrobiales bacterium]|nr:SOS response-associated peptidase [Acidimicrobiales bacterium]